MIEVKKDKKSACYMIVTTNKEGFHSTLFVNPEDYDHLIKYFRNETKEI